MSQRSVSQTDFIRELRLRRWARKNYVPQEDRKSSWHPVVLEEMNRKDRELEEQTTYRQPCSPYVPLEPTVHRLHGPHSRRPFGGQPTGQPAKRLARS